MLAAAPAAPKVAQCKHCRGSGVSEVSNPCICQYGEAVQPFTLAEGETYVGLIGSPDGEAYHLILLPGDNDDANWQTQMDWAKSIGGDLPNLVELALLFAHNADKFNKEWYWSNEVHSAVPAYAWYQTFLDGNQYDNLKSNELRARAVRRLPI